MVNCWHRVKFMVNSVNSPELFFLVRVRVSNVVSSVYKH